jgi:hypothetical protein
MSMVKVFCKCEYDAKVRKVVCEDVSQVMIDCRLGLVVKTDSGLISFMVMCGCVYVDHRRMRRYR